MSNAIHKIPPVKNEKILDYAPGSEAREEVQKTIASLKHEYQAVPMVIDGKDVFGRQKVGMVAPHEIHHKLGHYTKGTANHVKDAIAAATRAKHDWMRMSWQDRTAIFLKAADLITGPRRAYMSATTMIAQSKNVYQAEIDAIAELADFFRFNAQYVAEIYSQQPNSSDGVWNSLEYRPLEGFVFALTPFNFTAISGNLPAAPAMMGNTVVWKPAESQIYSAIAVMNILREAGLPDGVINLVYTDGPTAGKVIFKHTDFGGLHFTGSSAVFNLLWSTIGGNISKYKSYPRIVGETGGKDFVVAHPSADAEQLSVALLRGAFEYQGQKCSAASRAYIPKSLWPSVKKRLLADMKTLKMGSVEDFSNFINAVIDAKAYKKITGYISAVGKSKGAKIIAGGKFSDKEGYFIEPTVIEAKDPMYRTMCEEVFGPVLTIHVYDDAKFSEILKLVDSTSPYALTGSIFATDRKAVIEASDALTYSAGNFYINDKPTGAVVGQQPFGGARASGTNDKAGSILNLYRWISPRTVKETFAAPRNYRYPFLG